MTKPLITKRLVKGFILPALLSPTGIMGIAIVVLTLSNILFYNLWTGAKEDEAIAKATLLVEREQAKHDAEQARIASDRITLDVSNSWSAALDNYKRNPIRVRTNCSLQNGHANSTGGLSAPVQPQTVDTGTISPAECEIYLSAGIEDAINYEWLMYWVSEQLKKNPQ